MREFDCETKQCAKDAGLEFASVRVSDKPAENKLLCARSRLINSLCPPGTIFSSAQLTFTAEVLLVLLRYLHSAHPAKEASQERAPAAAAASDLPQAD